MPEAGLPMPSLFVGAPASAAVGDATAADAVEARFPDFFLVGAPRCGTTAMSHYLGHHPKICFSRPKEPHFFSLLRQLMPQMTVADYLAHCFPHYDPTRHRAVGEGSVSYLYDATAIATILAHNPEVRFIVMVRNPVDLVYSYHARLVALLDEDVEDFASAWRLQETRARGECIPQTCRNPFLLQYAEIGRLGKYLERLWQQAGRERCLVQVFDDFVADPRQVYLNILDFIGVEDDGRTEFPPRESNKVARIKWLQRWLKRPPTRVASFAATLEHQRRRKQGKKKSTLKRLRKRLLKWNTVYRPRPPLPKALRAELVETFAADIDRLGELLKRDLSHWKRI